MTFHQTENGALFAEYQGCYAPEMLPDDARPLVFSREFTDGERIVTISAAPTLLDRFVMNPLIAEELPAKAYDVTTVTEVREAGDDGGDTSSYTWDALNYVALTLEDAITQARDYIAGINPETDFA